MICFPNGKLAQIYLKLLENPKPLDMYQLSTNLSSRFLSCPSDQFACKDGSGCIPYWAVCSGSGAGCKDLSHTLASQCNNCTADHLFKCKMGGVDMCLHTNFICDGAHHCMDGSDESESLCSPPCSTGMFACANGLQCIPRSALCNGFGNCGDLSHTRPFQCDNCAADHLFKCQISGVDVCLNARFKCDGFGHCHDNVDEKPDDDQFICDDGLGCFPLSYRCDAVHDCQDASDESESLCTPPCPSDMFACSDGSKCIPRSKFCNGFGSCVDFSHSLPSHCDNCSADHLFKCQHNGVEVCLDVRQKCDGTIHCDDGDDEKPSECGGCHSDLFACADDSFCIQKSDVCNGKGNCKDLSHTLLSQCNNCTADHLFMCERGAVEVDVCFDVSYKCNGRKQCSGFADELVSHCPECLDDPSKFSCSVGGQMVCLSKEDYQCNGYPECDDGIDEDPLVCDNCNRTGLAMCRDGTSCFNTDYACNGRVFCADGTDKSDTYHGCKFCTENGSVPCPGFPGNCGTPCDGVPTCPDHWDEILSNCESSLAQSSEVDASICSKEAGLYLCEDKSKCLDSKHICDNYKDCADGSDESSVACKDKCFTSYAHLRGVLHRCDNDSCILLDMACSAQNRPLCLDGSDMDFSFCKGKCYTRWPEIEDPYRWPCAGGLKKCILYTSRCDAYPDCDDGTELALTSDERNCPLVTRIGLFETSLLCLSIVALTWILFFALIVCGFSLEESEQNPKIDRSMLVPCSALSPSGEAVPSFLLHPALSDMGGQSWNWHDVGEQLRLEVIFFNRDPEILFSFLYHIEAHDAHPDIVHVTFKGFQDYLTSKGYDPTAVALSMRQTIGHHRLAHMALRRRPNSIEKRVFEMTKWLNDLENKGIVFIFLARSVWAFRTSISPFLLNLDYVKDLALFFILRETVNRIDSNLAASGTEHDILMALLIIFCTSIILTSINSFFLRKRFFRTNNWLHFVFGVFAPLLPAIYHIRLSQMRLKLEQQKHRVNNAVLQRKNKYIESISNSVQQIKEIEVGLEAVMQIMLLVGLACFFPYTFKAPSGQTYSYFFGVAHVVLKGNIPLFLASIIVSLFCPCYFYANRTNLLRHGSVNMSRRLVLMLRNLLLLLVRVSAITSAIFIPVIKSWDVFIKNQGIDASFSLERKTLSIEFQKYFSKSLDSLTDEIRKNAQFFVFFLVLHFMLVASHAILCSAKFGKSMMRERLIYLVSSFWLPLPFLTIKGVDRGEEKAELWFLVVLHSLENFLIVLSSKIVYTRSIN